MVVANSPSEFCGKSLMPASGNGSHGTVGGVLGVEDELTGREQLPVSMERSGGCSSLLWGEGLTSAQPREGEFHSGHRGAESLGG